jgi:hypothetical protein
MDELYDLSVDPFEMTNAIGQANARPALDEMKAELNRLLRATK